jgi:hypothetical protein
LSIFRNFSRKKKKKERHTHVPAILKCYFGADDTPTAGLSGLVAGWGVAVAGWQWDQSTEEISAVRMVCVREWQWQYWQSCEIKMPKFKKLVFFCRLVNMALCLGCGSGMGSGSGRVAVVPIDRLNQRGSNGINFNV